MPEDRSVLERPAPGPVRTWRYGSGPDQVADLYLPADDDAEPRIPIVLVHGGYWRPEYDRLHLRPMAAALAERGHVTVLVEYTRRPGDPDAAVTDIEAALSALGQVDELAGATAVTLVGHSAGGHLALVISARRHPAVGACLALAPVSDLALAEQLDLDDGAARAYLGGPAADRPDLDPSVLRVPPVPVTVLHGTADTLVPPEMSVRFAERGVRHVPLPDADHFALIDPHSAAWPAVIAELDAFAARRGEQ